MQKYRQEVMVRFLNVQSIELIHPANEPYLIAGVATYALEIFEEVPDLDVIVVPLGRGSGASGCCLVKKAVCPPPK